MKRGRVEPRMSGLLISFELTSQSMEQTVAYREETLNIADRDLTFSAAFFAKVQRDFAAVFQLRFAGLARPECG